MNDGQSPPKIRLHWDLHRHWGLHQSKPKPHCYRNCKSRYNQSHLHSNLDQTVLGPNNPHHCQHRQHSSIESHPTQMGPHQSVRLHRYRKSIRVDSALRTWRRNRKVRRCLLESLRWNPTPKSNVSSDIVSWWIRQLPSPYDLALSRRFQIDCAWEDLESFGEVAALRTTSN